jgi:hypothetical protein
MSRRGERVRTFAQCQRILEVGHQTPDLKCFPIPETPISPDLQSLLDSNSSPLISQTARLLKQAIDIQQFAALPALLDHFASLLFIPLSADRLDLVAATSEMKECFEALELRISQRNVREGSGEETSFLRLFTFSAALIAITSPTDVNDFLAKYLDRESSESAPLLHSNRQRINRWFEKLFTCPSPVIRCGREALNRAFVKLRELFHTSENDRQVEHVMRTHMEEIEEDLDALGTDWSDDSATRIGHQVQTSHRIKMENADLIAGIGSHVVVFNANRVFMAESMVKPKEQLDVFDYGFVKKNYNSRDNGRMKR